MTTKILQNAEPTKWKEHFYGLPLERWNSLQGKSFWITGAGTGYGRCISCGLAAAGGKVFLTGRRIEKLQETIQKITTLGISTENCHIVEADITDYDEIMRACNKIKSLCSALYGLVNNAAIPSNPNSSAPLQNDSIDYWNKIMSTNVMAPWLLTRTIFPHMFASDNLKVLFITSGAGWAATPGFGMYNISKAALNSLSHSIAQEYACTFIEKDIQINALVAGEARTEMNQGSSQSPYAIVSMVLILLSHPPGGPNGKFFHRDGHHLRFGATEPYDKLLI